MAYANTTRSGASSLGERINAFLDGLLERNRRYRMYLRTANELSNLTDRELTDLAIHRSQISEIAREAAYGK